jgi:hypothetical protein
MTEDQQSEMTPEEQYEALMQHLRNTINPLDFMTPGQREIAMLTDAELLAEYALVQSKTSTRSRAQRDLIVDRYDYETAKADAQKDAE